MNKYKNKKGFTLVELLAVIVVLAIIMVIAVPTILNNMNNAKIKSFQLEGQRILDLALAHYESEGLMGSPNFGSFTSGTNTENCYNFSDFKMNPSGYEGFVIVNYSIEGNQTDYKLYLTNGIYSYVGASYKDVYAGKEIKNTSEDVSTVKAAKCTRPAASS